MTIAVTNRLIGIVAASEDELEPFLKRVCVTKTEIHAMLTYHIGNYDNIALVAVYSGVCKVNAAVATQILIDRFGVSKVIMIGVAGAMDPELKIADTVVSAEIVYHDVADVILTEYHPWMKTAVFPGDAEMLRDIVTANAGDKTVMTGKIVTGEAFIDQTGREDILKRHAPLCVDMESGAAAHVCYVNGTPFIAVRSISDTPHESGAEAFEKYAGLAARKAAEVTIHYLDYLTTKTI